MRSRRWLGIAAGVGLAVLVLNLALWVLYRDSRRGLEDELARRLETVVAVLAQLVDPSLIDRAHSESLALTAAGAPPESLLIASAYDSLRTLLRDVARTTDLANVRAYDLDGIAFLDLAAGAAAATQTEALDPAGVLAALTGSIEHSKLYQTGDEFLMAGYAPVRDADGSTIAALAVEADARFFGALQRLRFAMVASAALSILVLLALGAGFARLQASLQRAEEAMQRAETLAAMGRLAAGIAHEIRNPLGIIQMTAARLKKRYDDPANPDERFEYIREEVERLNGILTGYLAFARDEPPRLEPLDLVPLVERSLRLVAPELETPGVQLELDLPPACPVRGDPQRLQQVVLNLVLNAVQAMPAGGRLRVALHCADGAVRLAFEDTGPGFAPAVRARLGEPFVTTKEKGSGLGLATAKRIVEQHGGVLALGDAPGGGARVEVRLPVV